MDGDRVDDGIHRTGWMVKFIGQGGCDRADGDS